MPARKSLTMFCAPKPSATPTMPAPASSGPSSTPTAPRISIPAMTHTATAAMLLNTAPIVSVRIAARERSIGDVSASGTLPENFPRRWTVLDARLRVNRLIIRLSSR